MKSKKLAALMAAAVMSATSVPFSAAGTATAAGKYNYAEALQKSMFFYEVQQSGVLPEWNMVSWRADSMVDETGKDTDKVPGGWYDAGDHFKFTLTNAYSVSLLAWGYLEYTDAVKKAGLDELYKNNMKFAMDYVLGCDLGGGETIGTIGDGDDHVVWCSPEVYLRKHHLKTGDWTRDYDVIKNSTVAALSAAALAQGYIIFKDENYLKHAKDLFEGADKIRDSSDIGGMANMYNTSTWLDDCMYAACWLYKATGDKSYLDKIESDYVPNFPKENQSTDWKYTWGLAWDDTTQAAALLYAQLTEKEEWIAHIDKHIRYWMGTGDSDLKPFEGNITKDGLSHLTGWGCLRHACNTAWLTKLACDTLFKADMSKVEKYNKWADSQVNYCFGDNALDLCYVLGMGESNPKAIHHRGASGIHDDHWNELGKASGGAEGWQTEYAHTLYGALIGGPKSDGSYDMTQIGVSNYEQSEVAIDYNAGYTAVLCAMLDENGGTPLADFPPVEEPKWAEWEVAAVLNGKGDTYTEIKMWAMNHTAWPTRVQKDIEVRYYFDISEVLESGLTVDDIKVEGKAQQYTAGEQGYATVSGPHLYKGNVYYASIKFEDGRAIQPTGQSEHRDEVQFRISIPDGSGGKWDPTNDPSYDGIGATDSLKSADALNENFTMFANGAQVWGSDPDGNKGYSGADLGDAKEHKQSTITTTTTTTTTTLTSTTTTFDSSAGRFSNLTTTTTTVTTTTSTSNDPDGGSGNSDENNQKNFKAGDVNCDGTADIKDAVLLARKVGGDVTASITEEGMVNAELDGKTGVQAGDLTVLLRLLARLTTENDILKNLGKA